MCKLDLKKEVNLVLEWKIIASLMGKAAGKVKSLLRDKERNQKEYFLPYYGEVESVFTRHLVVITWLNEENNTCFYSSEEEMLEQMEQLDDHNKEIFKNSHQASDGKSLLEMSVEIENLVVKLKGVVEPSLILSLEQYAPLCREAHEIGEAHFLQEPCQNILDLTRDLKGNIPTVHRKAQVQ